MVLVLVNPFIYAAKYREFQMAVRRMLDGMHVHPEQPSNIVAATSGALQA